uniref:Aldehyde dehydrogenase n=1 Tax=Ascaris suum TaxID=6253 RepID=F1KTN9_ASCSU
MAYHQLVEKQREYFKTGETTIIEHRKKNLRILKQLIEKEHEILEEAVYDDLKRVPKATYGLEFSGPLCELNYMLDNIDEWAAPQKVEKTFLTILDTPMIAKDPLGVVLIISPWNYPIYLVIQPLIAAIAAGNTVIIKPSEISMHTAEALHNVFSKYFDPRYITVVNGGVDETTELLKERFDHILYTGCPAVGKIVMKAAATHLTPVTLELGGKCPVVVESDVDIKITAKRIAWGKWVNCGQTCLAPDYILTTNALKQSLVNALQDALDEFYGASIQTSIDYSRIINKQHFDRLSTILEKSTATILYKGGELDRDDLFIPPIIIDANKEDATMENEIFGPILPIISVNGFNEAIEFIRSGEKPLAAYLFTHDEHKIRRFYTETSSGGVTINDVVMHVTVDTLPFGGVGQSGMGRYHGKFGFETFSHEKAILKRGFFGESLTAVRYPPLTDKKFAEMNSLMSSRKSIPKLLRSFLSTVPVVLIGILIGVLIQRYGLK